MAPRRSTSRQTRYSSLALLIFAVILVVTQVAIRQIDQPALRAALEVALLVCSVAVMIGFFRNLLRESAEQSRAQDQARRAGGAYPPGVPIGARLSCLQPRWEQGSSAPRWWPSRLWLRARSADGGSADTQRQRDGAAE